MWKAAQLEGKAVSIATIGVFLAISACSPLTIEQAMVNGRPECPRHDSLFVDSAGTWVPRPAQIAGSGIITSIPEYHDCQRFLVKDASPKKFGPLVAIFARFHMENVGDPIQYVPLPPTSTLVAAGTVITQQTLRTITVGKETGTEMAVATILDYDEDYLPLHIVHGYNCLYVYHSSPTSWAARIVKATGDAACVEPLDTLNTTSWPLGITPYYDANPPAVSRWDWDPAAREHYVGIRCGSSWCEVYNRNLATHTPSPTYPGRSKGAYDEQYLAEATTLPGNPDGLAPGATLGTVMPIGFLDQNSEAVFTDNWWPVAQVSLSEESQVYHKKFRYYGGPAPDGPTVVSLCKGDKRDCVPLTYRPSTNGCANQSDPWWARIVSTEGTKYRCVIRRLPPTGAPLPPAVVRWRWKLHDEGMWIRCPGGCCEKT